MVDVNLLWNKIEKYDAVSFDIFDTLIKRNVSNPRDIFDVVEKEYNNTYTNKIYKFAVLRAGAERIALNKFGKSSVTLQEIYDVIDLPSDDKVKLMQLEIDIEVKYCKKNYNLKPLYDKVLSEGKQIIIISDMYLPTTILEGILSKCGYRGYSQIFVSCDYNATKRRGQLFDVVLEQLRIQRDNIVHIGDDWIGDYVMPKLHGIKAIHIQRHTNSTLTLTNKEIYKSSNVLFAFLNNMLGKYADRNIAFRIGYETLGPILYGYTEWIHKQIVGSNIEHAYFLARDMYLFFDVYKKCYGDKGISYLEVSRRSLRKAYIVSKKDILCCKYTMTKKENSDAEYAKALDVSVGQWSYICQTGDFTSILNDAQLTRKYLEQQGTFQKRKAAIVDIGWRGTSQYILLELTDNDFFGIYWYWHSCSRDFLERMEKVAYCGCAYSLRDAKPEVYGTSGLLESLLFPRVGTTVGYKQVGDKIVPVHSDCEMENTEKIDELQRGAMRFVDDCIAEKISFGEDNFSLPFLNMAQHPNKQIVEFFKSWRFEDNMAYTTICLRPWNEYLKNPKLFMKDFHVCFWKEGFLVQVLPGFVNPSWLTRVMRRIIWTTKGMP